MASYGTMHNRSTSSSTSAHMDHHSKVLEGLKEKVHRGYSFLRFFGFPSSSETAAVRIIRNLQYFRQYYILVVWGILFVSLVPKRRISLIFLIGMTVVAYLYQLLLRLIPNSIILQKIVDKRLVFFLLLIVTVVELILTRAIIHLLVSAAIGLPIILVHAIFRVSDDLFVNEEASAAGELVPLVHKEIPDVESQT